MIVTADGDRPVGSDPVEHKAGTAHEVLQRRSISSCRSLWQAWARLEVDRLKPSFQVQCPWLPVNPDAVPVEQSIGGVTRLLDLRHHQASTEGMHSASRNQEAISNLWFYPVHYGLDISELKCRFEGTRLNSWLEPGIDTTLWFRLKHNPGFGLAPARGIQPRRESIIRVDLDREVVLAIEEFEDQGK